MKSKTSCFNKTIFKKNVTRFWPIWLLYMGYLVFALPVNLWLDMASYNRWDVYTQTQRQLMALSDTLGAVLNPLPTFIFAGVSIMAVFSYLYSARNANMIHALPVDRLELFVTNFSSAAAFMIIPQTIMFVITVFVCIAARVTYIQYILYWYGATVGTTFFALAQGAAVAMLTGHIAAFPFYYVVANFLYVGVVSLAGTLVNTLCFGVSESWEPKQSGILSPMYYLRQSVGVEKITDKDYMVTSIQLKGMQTVLIYVGIGVVLLVVAYEIYKRRQIETAGDLICISFIKPVFRWGIAVGLGMELGVALTDTMRYRMPGNQMPFALLMVCVLLMEILCFFVAQMLLKKSFRVLQKKRVAECAAVLGISAAFLIALEMDLFGIERYIPALSEIQSVSVNMDYPIQFEGEDVQTAMQLQQEILSQKDEFLASDEVHYVGFTYNRKDGSKVRRSYQVPVSAEYIGKADSTARKILALEEEPDCIRQYLFGKDYENNEYYAGSISFTLNERDEDYHFTREELEEIVAAVRADIDDGALAKYQLMSMWDYEDTEDETDPENEKYCNNLFISYYNPDGVKEIGIDYYTENVNTSGGFFGGSYTSRMVENGQEYYPYEKNGTACVAFGSDCTHLIETLNRLGITTENRRLMTEEEYNEQYAEQ